MVRTIGFDQRHRGARKRRARVACRWRGAGRMGKNKNRCIGELRHGVTLPLSLLGRR